MESAFAIANYFLQKAAESGIKLTPMKLLKLVYIAHGWHLGLTGKPLIQEEVQAWKYGPVIESLYHALKQYGNRPIPDSQPFCATLKHPEDVIPILEKVWRAYSRYSGAQLSTATHREGTPWKQTVDQSGGVIEHGMVIPDELIEGYYRSKIESGKKTPEGSLT